MEPKSVTVDEETRTALVTFPAGGVVEVNGIPVELVSDTVVRTHKNNVPLIDHEFRGQSGKARGKSE